MYAFQRYLFALTINTALDTKGSSCSSYMQIDTVMTNSKKEENQANEYATWRENSNSFYEKNIFVNVYKGLTTYLPHVYICLHFADHPPTSICKRKL